MTHSSPSARSRRAPIAFLLGTSATSSGSVRKSPAWFKLPPEESRPKNHIWATDSKKSTSFDFSLPLCQCNCGYMEPIFTKRTSKISEGAGLAAGLIGTHMKTEVLQTQGLTPPNRYTIAHAEIGSFVLLGPAAAPFAAPRATRYNRFCSGLNFQRLARRALARLARRTLARPSRNSSCLLSHMSRLASRPEPLPEKVWKSKS